jgi:hypothetical protein
MKHAKLCMSMRSAPPAIRQIRSSPGQLPACVHGLRRAHNSPICVVRSATSVGRDQRQNGGSHVLAGCRILGAWRRSRVRVGVTDGRCRAVVDGVSACHGGLPQPPFWPAPLGRDGPAWRAARSGWTGREPDRPGTATCSRRPDWSVPAFMDTELGCQLAELPIS